MFCHCEERGAKSAERQSSVFFRARQRPFTRRRHCEERSDAAIQLENSSGEARTVEKIVAVMLRIFIGMTGASRRWKSDGLPRRLRLLAMTGGDVGVREVWVMARASGVARFSLGTGRFAPRGMEVDCHVAALLAMTRGTSGFLRR